MRIVFHQQLEALTARIAELCGLAGQAMDRATQALLQGDLVLAEQVIADHDALVVQAARTQDYALTLLALQSP